MSHATDSSTPCATSNHKFTFWVAVSFTLNYIVGSGFLTLPWAFEQTGPLLGVIVLSVFALFAILAVSFILEASERASTFLSHGKSFNCIVLPNKNGYQSIEDNSLHDDTRMKSVDCESNLTTVDSTEVSTPTKVEIFDGITLEDTDNSINKSEQIDRKFEITELCDIFLGQTGKNCYAFFLSTYMYGTLWAYSCVFSLSFSSHIPITAFGGDAAQVVEQSYYVYLVLFGLAVVPVSLMEFSEQISVQVALTVFRIVMLVVMLASIAAAYFSNNDAAFSCSTDHSALTPATTPTVATVHFDKLYLLLPIVAYAFIFHHSVPSLAHPVEDKRSLSRVFTVALMVSLVAYASIGVVISMYFGSEVMSTSNLNWECFVGVRGSDGSVPIYARIVSFFVVLFPALDVASAFPLNAYTLGNNTMSAYYGSEMHKHEKSRVKLNVFRALAAVPPIFGAMVVKEISHITSFTGLSGFAVMFIFPPLLAHYSTLRLEQIGVSAKTIHSHRWTSTPFQILVGASGILLLIVVSSFLILYSI